MRALSPSTNACTLQVLAFYRGMGMPLPEAVPLMLVDGFTLNEHSGLQGKDTHSSGLPVFHVRGLTLATTVQTIPTIVEAVPGGAAARCAELKCLSAWHMRSTHGLLRMPSSALCLLDCFVP